jgi:UDP-glucose 4-epimerase
MINRALQNMPLNIYGDGSQVRCFSPVADVLEPLALACKGATDSEIINIGPDEGWITIRSLAERINAQTENKAGLQFLPPRPNEVHAAYCTATKARRLLGFESRQSLDDCLSDMVEFVHATGTRPFAHFAPIEISSPLLPKTWKQH